MRPALDEPLMENRDENSLCSFSPLLDLLPGVRYSAD
jgi:hypothetical protein